MPEHFKFSYSTTSLTIINKESYKFKEIVFANIYELKHSKWICSIWPQGFGLFDNIGQIVASGSILPEQIISYLGHNKIWRKKWRPTPVFFLAWEMPWTEEPGRLQSTGLQSQKGLHSLTQDLVTMKVDSSVIHDHYYSFSKCINLHIGKDLRTQTLILICCSSYFHNICLNTPPRECTQYLFSPF